MSDSGIPMSAAVLEDEETTGNAINEELSELAPDIRYTKDYKSFVDAIESTSFDAVSLDLWVGSIHKGHEAIDHTASQQPDSAKIVYTQYDRLISDTARSVADVILSKDRPSEYKRTMRKALYLGRARRVLRRLRELGVTQLPSLKRGQWITESLRQEIAECARRASLAGLLSQGTDDAKLRKLLTGAGWWKSFDPVSYISLSARKKLNLLLEFAKILKDDLRRTLKCDANVAENLLTGSSSLISTNAILDENVDKLLSILGYFLHLANYNPELVSPLWRQSDMFTASQNRPPWDKVSASSYLCKEGPPGIRRSLAWIRSH